MKAWILNKTVDLSGCTEPLQLRDIECPEPGPFGILLRVSACGVCHTELDEIEGRLSPRLPVIPGHQVIGEVVRTGPEVTRFRIGDRAGVAWIYSSCGHCPLCRKGLENLCPDFKGTGLDADGGYAEYMVVDEEYAYPVPQELTDVEAAPLLCAGAIGYRSLRLTNLQNGESLGLTGFGGSGHLVLKMVRSRFPDSDIYVFARNPQERSFALQLGAVWAGETDQPCPQPLRAIIDTTPVWTPVVAAMANLAPGGRLVINAIRKEDSDKSSLLNLEYHQHLWREKELKTVANVCRRDVGDCLRLAAEAGIRPEVEVYPFAEANRALLDLKRGRIRGAKVLRKD